MRRRVREDSVTLHGSEHPAGPPPRLSSAVARFMLGALAAIAVVVVGGYFALRSVTINEAERATR